MYKTEEEQKLEDEANKYCYMNRVIDNLKVKQQNGRLWTPYHDMQLYEYVIKYKFNFYEISNAFQKLCINDKKYEYSEDAVRLHWAFLHAMRNFNQTPDEAYYQRMKLQYDKEKPKTFKNTVEEREKMLSEEEDIKRMKEELEKMQKEKEEKEKKIKEEKEKKEKERLEKEKKEEQEVEELISTTKKRNETNEEEKQTEQNNEVNDEKNKEENIKTNNDNKLYDENNEPEYIKQLFSNKIPQEILDKLNRDQGKYNNNTNTSENNNIINENNIKENKENDKNELKKEKEQSNINNNNNIIVESDINININLDINKEISKKENEINKINNIDDDDEDLFPIKSKKQKDIAEPGKIENINMEQELRNTQDFNDYIQSNPELKKQYEQLNSYCNFAVKSLNYIVNKGAGVDSVSESEAQKIEQTNRKLNEFLLEPIIKKTEEDGLTLEDWNKKIEEEEHKMAFETTNYDNYMKNAPKDEERDMKLNKFKEHLFGFAEKISTEELLEKITGIISQSNIIENNNNQQNENQANNNNIINNNNINLENQIQNFMNNLENNNIEDEKSENTKEQSESINENNADDNGRNTISSIGSIEIPKKYRRVYRGIVYYSDKPDENDKRNRNNRNVNNKKKKDEDDEIEEDDDDDDDYNK